MRIFVDIAGHDGIHGEPHEGGVHGVHGVLGLFQDLDPVVNRIAGDGTKIANAFDSWATGPGGRAFAHRLTGSRMRPTEPLPMPT